MAPISRVASALSLATFGARSVLADCISYGMDFQNGGSYFQNSLSNDDFTFVSQFEGCEDDTAYNIFVNGNGDQTLCSDTNLTPDDTDQLSDCPIEKSQLTSGNYSIVIMSNNGDSGDPIAYQRDFVLSVGPQSTSTYTPTITDTFVYTPVVTSTDTTTTTTVTTLAPSTVTSPSVTRTPTTTITPARKTTTSTKALLTLTFTSLSIDLKPSTKTVTASCRTPTRAGRDFKARIKPTVGPLAITKSSKFRREVFEEEKRRFVEERAARLELLARAPDPQPLVVTDTDSANYPTVTSTSTAPATTAVVTAEATTTSTSTPPAVTVLKGKKTAPAVTVTAPTPTKTVVKYTVATTTVTKTLKSPFTITKTVTPAATKSACKAAGGILT